MNQKICIAVVDCIDSNAFRVESPANYLHNKKVAREERENSRIDFYELRRNEEEDKDLLNFDRVIKKIGKRDEFKAGYLNIPDDFGKPFFTNPETHQLFSRYNPRVINKAEYEKIIEITRKMIAERYYQILQDPNNWRGVLETKMEMWEGLSGFPYDLDGNNTKMTNVFEPEIQIWDLIRMYKSIDWMRDNVVVYNW